MDASFRFREVDSRAAVLALIVALIGLAVILSSVAFGQAFADAAVRGAGGSLPTDRYELLLQMNAEAARIAGAVLLGVGAFVGLRRL